MQTDLTITKCLLYQAEPLENHHLADKNKDHDCRVNYVTLNLWF